MGVRGPTPVNADRLAFWLEGYDGQLREFLLDGFRFGFKVGYTGIPLSTISPNLVSVNERPDIIKKYIDEELAAGRILGPFVAPPFEIFQCSPVGLVPKKGQRFLSDHSSPVISRRQVGQRPHTP
jgi:hypothetical protein